MRISFRLWGVLKNNSCYLNCPVVWNDPLSHSWLIDYSRLILYLSDIPHKSDCHCFFFVFFFYCHCGKQLVDVGCNTCSVISLRQVLSCSRGSSRCDPLICDPQQHRPNMYRFCFLAFIYVYDHRRSYICISYVSLLSDKLQCWLVRFLRGTSSTCWLVGEAD